MKKEIEELQGYLHNLASFSLPKYKELPLVGQYMEQVLTFINGALSSLSPHQERALTSFMVNNYVKAKMIEEPVKKKYSRDQIGYLMAICLMKTTISMSDMSILLEYDKGVSSNKDRLYAFFCELETSILSESAKKTAPRVEEIYKRYRGEVAKKAKSAEENAENSLALLALRLSIQAQANKLLSEYIIDVLRTHKHGKEASLPEKGSSELKKEKSLGKKEAKRLAEQKEGKKKEKQQ